MQEAAAWAASTEEGRKGNIPLPRLLHRSSRLLALDTGGIQYGPNPFPWGGRQATVQCPLLPYNPLDVTAVNYGDTDSPTGTLISDLQRRLSELGATDVDGSAPDVTGRYDPKTARILAHWIAADQARWPDPVWLEITWGHPVTDCRVWRALGFDCEAVEVIPGVTPMADAIQQAVSDGRLTLSCPPPAPAPEATRTSWVWLLALIAVLSRPPRPMGVR